MLVDELPIKSSEIVSFSVESTVSYIPRRRRFAISTFFLLLVEMAGVANAVGISWTHRHLFNNSTAGELVEISRSSSEDVVFKSGEDSERVKTLLTECEDGSYDDRTLKLQYEMPFAALFSDNKGQRKFEVSSVTLSVDKKTAYAICDSSWAVSKFSVQLSPFSVNNRHVGEVNRKPDEDSQYEAIFLDQNKLFVVRESIKLPKGETLKGYHAIIEELRLGENTYEVVQSCPADFEFDGDSKGFEGAIGIHDLNDDLVILGLCEGNHCSGKKDLRSEAGNGRIIVMRKEIDQNTTGCIWRTLRQISVPKSASFLDYSDFSITPSGKVGITSQENSQFWVGQLVGLTVGGLWDVNKIEFNESAGIVYDFPKNHDCRTIYCNVEGVFWINDHVFMAVSDKMKGKGKQDFRCFDKDQHIHVFMLPYDKLGDQ